MRKLTILWLFFLLVLSLLPLALKRELHTMGRLHDAGHLVAFFITALLMLWQRTTVVANLVWFLSAVGIAFALEFLEYRIYFNPFEWSDIAIDLFGVVLGGSVAMVWRTSGRAATPR